MAALACLISGARLCFVPMSVSNADRTCSRNRGALRCSDGFMPSFLRVRLESLPAVMEKLSETCGGPGVSGPRNKRKSRKVRLVEGIALPSSVSRCARER